MNRLCLLFLIPLFAACQSGSDSRAVVATQLERSFGEAVVYDEAQSAYIVGGDMLISEAAASAYVHEGLSTQQREFGYLVSDVNAEDITYYIEPDVPKNIADAHREAAQMYNALSGVKLKFREVDNCNGGAGLKPNCLTTVKAIDGCTVENGRPCMGKAYYPHLSGEPGRAIWYDTRYKDRPENQWLHVALHEIGHTIGLAHDFDKKRDVIPGTPARDRTSIMNHNVADHFSEHDIEALQVLYPSKTGSKSTPKSEAGPQTGVWYTLRHVQSGKYLDTGPNGVVSVKPENQGDGKLFKFVKAGGGRYYIVNKMSGRGALDSAPEGGVSWKEATSGGADKQWTLIYSGDGIRLDNAAKGRGYLVTERAGGALE